MYYVFVVWDQGQVQILLAIPVCNVWMLENHIPINIQRVRVLRNNEYSMYCHSQ